jgi:hypothetical protein
MEKTLITVKNKIFEYLEVVLTSFIVRLGF